MERSSENWCVKYSAQGKSKILKNAKVSFSALSLWKRCLKAAHVAERTEKAKYFFFFFFFWAYRRKHGAAFTSTRRRSSCVRRAKSTDRHAQAASRAWVWPRFITAYCQQPLVCFIFFLLISQWSQRDKMMSKILRKLYAHKCTKIILKSKA